MFHFMAAAWFARHRRFLERASSSMDCEKNLGRRAGHNGPCDRRHSQWKDLGVSTSSFPISMKCNVKGFECPSRTRAAPHFALSSPVGYSIGRSGIPGPPEGSAAQLRAARNYSSWTIQEPALNKELSGRLAGEQVSLRSNIHFITLCPRGGLADLGAGTACGANQRNRIKRSQNGRHAADHLVQVRRASCARGRR